MKVLSIQVNINANNHIRFNFGSSEIHVNVEFPSVHEAVHQANLTIEEFKAYLNSKYHNLVLTG